MRCGRARRWDFERHCGGSMGSCLSFCLVFLSCLAFFIFFAEFHNFRVEYGEALLLKGQVMGVS